MIAIIFEAVLELEVLQNYFNRERVSWCVIVSGTSRVCRAKYNHVTFEGFSEYKLVRVRINELPTLYVNPVKSAKIQVYDMLKYLLGTGVSIVLL